MSVEDQIRESLHRVEMKKENHLYWSHQRETLCGKDKVYALRVYYETGPTCRECLAVLGEVALESARRFEALAR